MSKAIEVMEKENILQAVVVVDNFEESFVPITNDTPLALIPVVNQPLIDYTLDFLSLGGIDEVFLFCCSHVNLIKDHIRKSLEEAANWSLTMKVHILVSESCRSFGDCLRDLDAKGLIRGNFVLLEAGAVSNIKLQPVIKVFNDAMKTDKGAAMTLIFQQAGVGQMGRNPSEDIVLASDTKNRVLFHQKLNTSSERKITLPLDMLVDNPTVSLRHDLKDTRIAICSSSVLPLFSDNFDFQTRDDFIRGLLMNEEIMGSTIYWHLVKGNQYGSTITGWRMYQAVSFELMNRWVYPIVPPVSKTRSSGKDVVLGAKVSVGADCKLKRCVVGDNVQLGRNVFVQDSFIFSDTQIGDNCVITHSIIDSGCNIGNSCRITAGSVIGTGVELEKDSFIENSLLQKNKPDFSEPKDKLGEKAYRLRIEDDTDDETKFLSKKFARLHIGDLKQDTDSDFEDFSESDGEDMSYTLSPAPDDTKLFFVEVIDSLTRGFEDKLQCDNLILEINSSRYAYNVTVKEVNFNVVKAILIMSLRQPVGSQYYSHLQSLLQYFAPILKNYIKNETAMYDGLQAIEDVATSNEELNEKWVMFVLNWLYDKDHMTEDVILDWFSKLDKKGTFHSKVKPFTDWLLEAEEASSEDE